MSKKMNFDELQRFIVPILVEGFKYTEDEARVTARVLVEADARGIPSHGVSRMEFHHRHAKDGFVTPGAQPEIVWQTPSSIVVDGHNGIGCYIAEWSVSKLIDLARNTGVGYCAVRSSNHFGIAGYWAETIAKNEMIGMAFTNTTGCAIPTYGRQRMLGTNPIAVAIPEAGGRIFMLDMATTTVSHGKIEVYDRRKKPMPLGWVVDRMGIGTTDATEFERLFYGDQRNGGQLFIGGEGEESGGHKGYGLGLLVELLCSGLSLGLGSAGTYAKGREAGITHFFGAVRLDLFGKPDELKSHIGGLLDCIRKSDRAEGQDRIYIHGEKETESLARSMKEGVFIDDATCAYLNSVCEEFGLPGLPKD